MDRPPEGPEADLFTYHAASEWDEHLVPIDVPAARKHLRALVHAFEKLPGLVTPLG